MCTVQPCDNGHNTCGDHGDCTTASNAHTCTCKTGWSGDDCNKPTGCNGSPCHNGGTCTASGGEHSCACSNGWSGSACDHAMGCDSSPCQHGGTCIGDGTKHTCQCASGWAGADCADSTVRCCSDGLGDDHTCWLPPALKGFTPSQLSAKYLAAEWLAREPPESICPQFHTSGSCGHGCCTLNGACSAFMPAPGSCVTLAGNIASLGNMGNCATFSGNINSFMPGGHGITFKGNCGSMPSQKACTAVCPTGYDGISACGHCDCSC